MKYLLLLYFLSPLNASDLRCRVVAYTPVKIQRSSWIKGATGCSTTLQDAKFAQSFFSDVIGLRYGIEVRHGKYHDIVWVKNDNVIHLPIMPPPDSGSGVTIIPHEDKDTETPGRLAPSN